MHQVSIIFILVIDLFVTVVTMKNPPRPPKPQPDPCRQPSNFQLTELCRIMLNNNNNYNNINNPISPTLINDTETNQIISIIKNISIIEDNYEESLTESSEILHQITNILSNLSYSVVLNEIDVNNSLKIVDAVIDVPDILLAESQYKYSMVTRMINAVEDIVLGIDKLNKKTLDINLNNMNFRSFLAKNSDIYGIGIKAANKNSTLTLYKNDFSPNSAILYNIFFNRDAVEKTSLDNPDLRLSFLSFYETKLFSIIINQTNCKSKLLSKQVISVTSNYKINPINNQLVYHIFNEFESSNSSCLYYENFTYQCVYFDFNLNDGYGDWSTWGCNYEFFNSTPMCVCNHTTNFAMLMIMVEQNYTTCSWCKDALSYTSAIGVGLSIIFLAASTIIFLVDEIKRIRMNKNTNFQGMFYHYYKLLIALCVNLLIFNILYLVFSFITAKNTSDYVCEAIGILLHFFLLNSFGMMLSMSILRYLMIYFVFKDIKSFSLISILSSFGISTLILIISTSSSPGATKYITNESLCWLSGINLLYVLIPIGLIAIINGVLFVLVLKEIRNNRNKNRLKNSKHNNENTHFEMLRVIAVCFFTTGLAWLFGFIVIIPLPQSLEYLGFIFSFLFCLLNAFQGFFIFFSSILIKKFFSLHNNYIKKKKRKNIKFNNVISPSVDDDYDKSSTSSGSINYKHNQLSAMSSVETMLSNIDYISVNNDIIFNDKIS